MWETWILQVDLQCHQVSTFTHVRAVVFSAFSMHYPQCKRRAVRMRNCRAPRRRVRDVTGTRAGVTDETLSRKSLARVQDTACKKAQVSSARTSRAWRHRSRSRNYGYNALADAPGAGSHLPGSIGHKLATEEVEKLGKVEYCRSIVPYGLFHTKGEMCAKFGWDRFRNVNLYKFHTYNHSALYIRFFQIPPSWTAPWILRSIFLSKILNKFSSDFIRVQVSDPYSIPSYPTVLLTQHAVHLSVDRADGQRACYVPNCADTGWLTVQRGAVSQPVSACVLCSKLRWHWLADRAAWRCGGFCRVCRHSLSITSPPAFHRHIHWSAIDFFL